jgi:DNA-binding IclR family transcriptional regulator
LQCKIGDVTINPRNNSSSLRRALSILSALSQPDGRSDGGRRGYSLTELATAVAASKSTVLRLVAPLLEARLVEQRSDGTYAIGVGAVTLGSAYLRDLDLRSVAQPVLARLAYEAKETAHLMVYSEGQVVYLDKQAGPSPIQMASRVGDRADVHSTSAGKAILAHLPDGEFRRVVASGLPAHTQSTLITSEALAADLKRVRARGFSVDDIENEGGIRCVAAPVFDHNDKVVAAVSLAGPADRIKVNLDDLALLIVAGANEISEHLGAQTDRSADRSEAQSAGTKDAL